MPRFPANAAATPPIPVAGTTALILINAQLGFRNPKAWGDGHSNPDFERNIASLLERFRAVAATKPEGQKPLIIHVQHRSVWTDSPLHPSHVGPYGLDGGEKRGVDFLEFAAPVIRGQTIYTFDEPPPRPEGRLALPGGQPSEILMTSHEHSIFINTPLLDMLKKRDIRTLVVAGLSLERGVSTGLRTAHNLAVIGDWGGHGNMVDASTAELYTDGERVYADVDEGGEYELEEGGEKTAFKVKMPRIILVTDGTRAFGKAGVDAETVHKVHVESLREFAEMRETNEVIAALAE